MSVAMKLRELRWRAAGHYRPLEGKWLEPLRDERALELGGPSALFRSGGLLPVYPLLASLDGVQTPAGHELWHGELREGPYETGEPGLTGRLLLRDAGELDDMAPGSYGAVISSHVIEHLANPLGALAEWRRVLRPGGHMLAVLPHKEGCADHRRPTTSLEHLEADAERGTAEDDLTHADEVIALHDLERDPPAGDRASLRARVLDNPRRRAMHHHVFTTPSALALFDRAGLELRAVEARWPHDIYVLMRNPGPEHPRPDNSALLSTSTASVRRSPFRSDRARS